MRFFLPFLTFPSDVWILQMYTYALHAPRQVVVEQPVSTPGF